MSDKPKLTRLQLSGYKSIQSLDLEFRPLNILIGANGSGKSNLLSFFELLQHLVERTLQLHIGRQGGGNTFLHYGAKNTPEIYAELQFSSETWDDSYQFQLSSASPDTLIFIHERIQGVMESSGSGAKESHMIDMIEVANELEEPTRSVLMAIAITECKLYHFHDSSDSADVMKNARRYDDRFLRTGAGNLAPYLLWMQSEKPKYYRRIVHTIQQIVPFFNDFQFRVEGNDQFVRLQWTEKTHPDYTFTADQASDGMIRSMALITLLLQPPEKMPVMMLMDEPELGLHPKAVDVIAGLIKAASRHTQIVLATQSATLIDYFTPEDVIVVDRPSPFESSQTERTGSTFRRLDTAEYSEWIKEYTLSEIWMRNLIGGRP